MRAALFGLGVMGANLALRIADSCADLLERPLLVYDVEEEKRSLMRARINENGSGRKVAVGESAQEAFGHEAGTIIFLMVPASAVPSALAEISPFLSRADAIIECGNSHFRETDSRSARANDSAYFGMGVSGGALGARHGPCLMLGGPDPKRIWPALERIAARVDGRPCLVHCGPGGAGHFVKMVHNAVEYSLMQGIAEALERLLHRGLSEEEAAAVCESWNATPELASYLMEITATVLRARDAPSGFPLLRVVSPEVGQKGTGAWALAAGIEAGVALPLLSAALMTRLASKNKTPSEARGSAVDRPEKKTAAPEPAELEASRLALSFVFRAAFREGLELLASGPQFGFDFDVPGVLSAWRGGCIIRCAHLDKLLAPEAPAPAARRDVQEAAARSVLGEAIAAGCPMPVLSAALGVPDLRRRGVEGLAILSLQRDFFGRHGFGRTDQPGIHHLPADGG